MRTYFFESRNKKEKSYDKNGEWASSGNINEKLLSHLLDDDYFRLAPPKSTGTEYFNTSWLTQKLNNFLSLSAEDIQASLAALTTKSIADAISAYTTDEIIICGGGVHNKYVLQLLKGYLPDIEMNSSASYGLDPDYIEATAFAWLAMRTLRLQPGNLPSVTGARREVVLGRVHSP